MGFTPDLGIKCHGSIVLVRGEKLQTQTLGEQCHHR